MTKKLITRARCRLTQTPRQSVMDYSGISLYALERVICGKRKLYVSMRKIKKNLAQSTAEVRMKCVHHVHGGCSRSYARVNPVVMEAFVDRVKQNARCQAIS